MFALVDFRPPLRR